MTKQAIVKKRFRMKKLSVSRLKKYEQCPLAFKFSYIDKLRGQQGEAAMFGSFLHEVLENVYKWVCRKEFTGIVPDKRIIKAYRKSFKTSGLTGEGQYRLGLELLRAYFANRKIDHSRTLALECKFRLKLGGFTMRGYIDRVDRSDNTDTLEINDYKSSRMLFTRDKMDSDLQMTIYGLAARKLWPWVKHIRFGYDMLRHGTKLYTSRTFQEMDDGADYAVALGERINEQREFHPNLNTFCHWCDHREYCEEYHEALVEGELSLSLMVATDNLEKVAAERERAAALKTTADRRRQELDQILVAHIENSPEGELIIGERRYKASQKVSKEYPREHTLQLLSDILNIPYEVLDGRLTAIHNRSLTKLINEARLPRSKQQLLSIKLDELATKSVGSPYVSSSKVTNTRKRKR